MALVAAFLIIMSIRDRKKMKKEKIISDEIEKIRSVSRENVIVYLKFVFEENEKMLNNFIPSVGKLKMGDIRNMAKLSLKNFKKTDEYKYAKDSDKNTELISIFNAFLNKNSNV